MSAWVHTVGQIDASQWLLLPVAQQPGCVKLGPHCSNLQTLQHQIPGCCQRDHAHAPLSLLAKAHTCCVSTQTPGKPKTPSIITTAFLSTERSYFV